MNTVRAVYQRLEQSGLIDRQQGSGTFVAGTPQGAAAVGTITANAAHEARETGVDPREVAAALYIDDAAAPAESTEEQSEQARRRSLRSQIAAFERAIAELEAEHPGVAPTPSRRRRGIGPALLTVEELARIRTDLIRRLMVVQAAIDEHIERRRAGATTKAPAREPRQAKAQATALAKKPKKAPRARATSRPAPAGG